jgi:carboxyl-terminal processing protease
VRIGVEGIGVMVEACRAGEIVTRLLAMRRGVMRQKGAFSVFLLLLLIGACASTGHRHSSDPAEALFAGAYREIRDYYLDPVRVDVLARAGIDSLASGTGLRLDETGGAVQLVDQGVVVGAWQAPAPEDADGWAQITAAAIAAARRHDAVADGTAPVAGSVAGPGAGDELLYQRVFDGITAKLDRFTRYVGAVSARDQKAARDGFGGIGITVAYDQAEPRITSVLVGGPSARAGLRVGDIIVAIDGMPTAGLGQRDITDRLRGRAYTRVGLAIRRSDHDPALLVSVQRSFIVPASVTSERDGNIAIFQVAVFNHDTAKTLALQLDRLEKEMGHDLKGIVLDLRGNPGGLLDQAVDTAGLFLDHGDIVSANGRHPTSIQNFTASGTDRAHGLPIIVLVDGGSASSAEIVAAALQDVGRAVVVGSSSFGKGTVQMVITLENTGELTLTWARLITPSGYILHHHGIVPAFCTSEAGGSAAAPTDEHAAVAQVIERGLHPVLPSAKRPRVSLDDAGWAELRASCPAETDDPPTDLAVAKALLDKPGDYAQALGLPGVAVAHDPDTNSERSALQ